MGGCLGGASWVGVGTESVTDARAMPRPHTEGFIQLHYRPITVLVLSNLRLDSPEKMRSGVILGKV